MHFPFQAYFINFDRKIETTSFWSCIKIPITIIPSLANMQNHLQCRLVAPASSRMVKSSDRAVIFALKCFRFVLQGIIHQSCHQLTSLQTNSKGSNRCFKVWVCGKIDFHFSWVRQTESSSDLKQFIWFHYFFGSMLSFKKLCLNITLAPHVTSIYAGSINILENLAGKIRS